MTSRPRSVRRCASFKTTRQKSPPSTKSHRSDMPLECLIIYVLINTIALPAGASGESGRKYSRRLLLLPSRRNKRRWCAAMSRLIAAPAAEKGGRISGDRAHEGRPQQPEGSTTSAASPRAMTSAPETSFPRSVPLLSSPIGFDLFESRPSRTRAQGKSANQTTGASTLFLGGVRQALLTNISRCGFPIRDGSDACLP